MTTTPTPSLATNVAISPRARLMKIVHELVDIQAFYIASDVRGFADEFFPKAPAPEPETPMSNFHRQMDNGTRQAPVAEAEKDFHSFAQQQGEWSQATFGTDAERGPTGPLKHLAKEVNECLANPTDIMEFADCLFLVLDASRRAGFDSRKLLDAAWEKLVINKARKWSKPTSDEPVEHVRTTAADE